MYYDVLVYYIILSRIILGLLQVYWYKYIHLLFNLDNRVHVMEIQKSRFYCILMFKILHLFKIYFYE